jgi:hypothetical protein
MLGITRTWNAIGALATMRRCIALARDYANRRVVFGKPLAEQPLHQDTLAGMQAEFEAAFHLAFYVTELLGRAQAGQADEAQNHLLRLLTPLIKLWTGKLAVAVVSEACECLGGAGYLEETGMPQLLRDAQVFPIWEGTTNVLALDFLRAARAIGVQTLLDAQAACATQVSDGALSEILGIARERCAQAAALLETLGADRGALEANARGIALGFARGLALTLLARHADWASHSRDDAQSFDAAQRFAALTAAASC